MFMLLHLHCPTARPGNCFSAKKWQSLLWCQFRNALWLS